MKRTTAMAVLLILGSACAHTGTTRTEGWHAVTSKRFTVYTGSARGHREALDTLEYHYAALSSSFFKMDVGRVDVLYLENADFIDLLGVDRGFAAMPRVPGGGKIGQNGLLVVRPLGGVGGAQYTTAEALTHLFVHRAIPGAPLWFHEGFAAYSRMAQYKEGEGRRVACFGTPGATDRRFMPLDRMLATSWDEYDGDEARTWYKHSARMLIDFAMHGDGGAHRPAMGVMVEGFLAEKRSEDVIKAAFPSLDIKALAERVTAHGLDVVNQPLTSRGLCPLGFPIPDDKKADEGERAETPADAADIKALLAGLRRLPRKNGFPAWYPPAIIETAERAPLAP
jgi:hypothetical protein